MIKRLILVFLLLASPVMAHAIKPLPIVSVTGTVLLGSTLGFTGIAVIDRKAVFQELPSWKKIVKNKISRNSARYHFLLKDANNEFRRIMEKVAFEHKVDLVVVSGGVTAMGVDVLDLTETILRRLR